MPRGEGWVLATLASAQIPDNPPLTILTTLSLPKGEGRGWLVPRGEGWVLATLASARFGSNPLTSPRVRNFSLLACHQCAFAHIVRIARN